MARMPSRYETLLRVRRRQEERCALSLASARRDVRAARQALEQIQAERAVTFETAGKTAAGRFDASDVRRYYQYERHLARLANDQDREIDRLREVEERRRAETEQAMIRRRTIERLRARCEEALEALRRKHEQELADEVGSNRAAASRVRTTPTRRR